MRAAVATIGPLLVAQSLGSPQAIWLGLAGFNVALTDKGGPVPRRLAAMLPTTFFGVLAATVAAVAGQHLASAVIATALWALGAGLARTYGITATSAATVSLAMFVVSLGIPEPTLAGALTRGAATLLGSAGAIVLSLLVGPFRPYRPARMAVARVYRALAHGGDVEAALRDARVALARMRRGLQGESHRGERLLVLVESAERIAPDPALAPPLERIAELIENERTDPTLATDGPLHDAVVAVNELNGRAPRPQLNLRAPIVSALTWESAVLRHAMRVAVVAALAVGLTSAMHIARGYWLTLTVIVVLQPYTSATLQRGLQRVAGTIAGGIFAAVLLSLVHSPLQMLVLVFIGAALTVAWLPVNYGLYSFVLTPTFVLLAEIHALDRHLVWLRIENTVFGALLALLGAWLLWPASERGRVRDDVTAALNALAEYARCVGSCDDAQVAESRHALLVALNNVEASVQRLLSDDRGEESEAFMTITVYMRRLVKSLDGLRFRAEARELAEPLHALASDVAVMRAPAPFGADAPEPLRAMRGAITRLAR
ncbi:MAG: FUSC family protein [Acidobacteria bacterium]|nr:FUSC family protein [Acidobacteriota bacterium]